MIVPEFWAEGRAQTTNRGRPLAARRWGWSDESQEAAQLHADQRARDALERILAGEKRPRREPKTPYNGAEGVPIREEIVARHGSTIVTRNSYGALCINTPRVLFADVDFPSQPSLLEGCLTTLVTMSLGAIGGVFATRIGGLGLATVAGVILGLLAAVAAAGLARKLDTRLRGGPEAVAMRRLRRFLDSHPNWAVRVYRTPAGLRVLVMHELFEPAGEAARLFFRALRADPVYVAMCRRQACFRARVSPKPWRIGIAKHITPRGVWPFSAERLPARESWLEQYEERSRKFASCRRLEELGSPTAHPEAVEVQRLHDELCRADADLPIA